MESKLSISMIGFNFEMALLKTTGHHLCLIDPKSALAWITAGKSAVVCLEFALTEVVTPLQID